jgi:hypothetical protein
MPAPKPSSPADWDTSILNLLAPSAGQIASGWAFNQTVPSDWLNWWQNLVGQWTDYLRDFEIQAHTWTVSQTMSTQALITQAGITGTQSIANTNAANFTGNGSGAGLQGTGGATNGYGLSGVGGGANGGGVIGQSTNGAGVVGSSSGNGKGGQFYQSGVKGAIQLVAAISDPSSPDVGDVWQSPAGQGPYRGKLGDGIVTGTPVLGTNLNSATGTWYYWLDLEGYTNLGGFVSRGVSGDNIVGQLPAAYRPTSGAAGGGTHLRPTNDSSTGAINAHCCRVNIATNGNITLYADGPASALAVSLDGIRFATF